MVFDPTFQEISKEADALPDQDGADDAEPLEGELAEDELPPFGDE